MENKKMGCAVLLFSLLMCVLMWAAAAYTIYFVAIHVAEALIPNADAAEVAAHTTAHTTAVDEKVVQTGAKLAKAGAKVEGTVEIQKDPATELPRQTIEEEPQEDFENQLIEEALLARAHRIDDCKITYYCCERYPHICGTGNGITALGNEVLAGVSCAVPPGIPLGSTIIIDWGDGNLEYRRADDRGSGVLGDHIDLAVPKHKEALDLGTRCATVYWAEEV